MENNAQGQIVLDAQRSAPFEYRGEETSLPVPDRREALSLRGPTLIVSLGILAKPWQLEVLMGAVVLLTLFAVLFNRLVGIPYPLWRTVSHKVSSGITVESDLWVCCTDTDKGEGCSDTNVCSNGGCSKREGLSRVKSTHVRLVPLDAGW
jgi:hypothetical protein